MEFSSPDLATVYNEGKRRGTGISLASLAPKPTSNGKARVFCPACLVLGIAMIPFPDYHAERLSRGEDITGRFEGRDGFGGQEKYLPHHSDVSRNPGAETAASRTCV
jgi:hypothetical protein